MHPVLVPVTASIVTHWKVVCKEVVGKSGSIRGIRAWEGNSFQLFPFRFASVIPPVVVEGVHYVLVVAFSSVGPFASSVFVCTLLALAFLGSFWFLL